MKIYFKFSAHCAQLPALPHAWRIVVILVVLIVLLGRGDMAVIDALTQ